MTLNNILGVGNKPVAPNTPPGIDSSLPGAAPVKQQQGTGETPAANGGMEISREEAKGISPVQATPEQKKPQPAEPQEPKRMSYEDMFRKLNPYKPPTPLFRPVRRPPPPGPVLRARKSLGRRERLRRASSTLSGSEFSP